MNQTSRFGDLHTRTYDIELLISGALVFGLLAAPGAITELFEHWQGRVDGVAALATTYLFVYGEMLVYSLLITFILHLCLRGYWIALLGVESVWSDGWSWDRLKLGSYSRPHLERMIAPLAEAINRADDRASIVFAAGAMLVMVCLYSLTIVLLAVAAGAAAEAVGIASGRVFTAALLVGFGPLIVIPMLDRRLGTRLPRESSAGRWFDRLVAASLRVSPVRLLGPIQFVFQSRIGERNLSLAMGVAATLIVAMLLAGLVLRAGTVRLDGWRYFDAAPSAGATIDPRHYRDSGARRDGRQPSIDGDVIQGPYLRLYLPYRPRRHNPRIAEACPGLTPGADNAKAAACVGGLYSVALDGEMVTASYEFTRDVASDFVGVMAYLPTSSLAAGRHELVIESRSGDDPNARETVRIPFYTAR